MLRHVGVNHKPSRANVELDMVVCVVDSVTVIAYVAFTAEYEYCFKGQLLK